MEWISVKQAALCWNVSERRVQDYLKQGRIPGAQKCGSRYLLPANAQKPDDPRKSRAGRPRPLQPRLLLLFSISFDPAKWPAWVEDELRVQAESELAYFSGDFEAALCAYHTTGSESPCRVSALTIAAGAALSLGNYELFTRINAELDARARDCAGDARSAPLVELSRASLAISAFAPELCPKNIAQCRLQAYPEESRGLAEYLHDKHLLSLGKFEQALGFTQGALLWLDEGDCTMAYIYLLLVQGCALTILKRGEEAAEPVLRAMRLALPLGLYSPFAEHVNVLMGTAERCFEKEFPSCCKPVLEQYARTSGNWLRIHNRMAKRNVSLLLSRREYQAALYVCEGCTNAEIAAQMGLSINTVKSLLKSINEKLFLKKRSEIRDYIL